MPFKNRKSVTMPKSTKQRLDALRGDHFGHTLQGVLHHLLLLGEAVIGQGKTSLDNQKGMPAMLKNVRKVQTIEGG